MQLSEVSKIEATRLSDRPFITPAGTFLSRTQKVQYFSVRQGRVSADFTFAGPRAFVLEARRGGRSIVFEVDHLGDYATFNSNQLRDSTFEPGEPQSAMFCGFFCSFAQHTLDAGS